MAACRRGVTGEQLASWAVGAVDRDDRDDYDSKEVP